MSEPAHPSGDRPVYTVSPPPPPRGGRPLAWLLALVLIALGAYGLWRGYDWALAKWREPGEGEIVARVTRDLETLRAQADALARQQAQLAETMHRTGGEVAALDGRLQGSEQAVARLADTVEGGRTRVQLAAVEQLLLMANDRLLLAHDNGGALKALDYADQRLALLNDPRLFKVREALAQERSALATLALPDTTGITLSLAEILKRAPSLPLRARAAHHFETEAEPVVPPPDARWHQRVWAAVKTALANIFALRRSDAPPPRLLPPEEEALVAQILQLKLEGARLALLANDARTFQDLAGGARDWLARYYDETEPAVRATLDELERLRGLKLAQDLPDISRSLALLRAQMGAPAR